MSYCSLQDLIDRFTEQEIVQLTDVDNLGVINEITVERALADTNAEIDGYLAGRYTLPFTSPVSTLNQKACDIARFYLHARKVPEAVQRRYDAVIRYFEQVAKGVIKLPIAEADATQSAINETVIASSKKVFARP